MKHTIWNNKLKGGSAISIILKRHRAIKFSTTGVANLAMLAYNANNNLERYNMADTLKGQHTAFLTKGNCLYSDMGRVLLSVVDDQTGWHDTFCGLDDEKMNIDRFGIGDYQELRNNRYRNGKNNILVELNKWGMSKKDIVSNVNLFSKVVVDEETGSLSYITQESIVKQSVVLRAEMDTLIVLSATHHPLYKGEYSPADIEIEMYESEIPSAEDYCRNNSDENKRAFINTENFIELGV